MTDDHEDATGDGRDDADGRGDAGGDDRGADWLSEVRSGYDEIAAVYDDQRDTEAEEPLVEGLEADLDPGSLVVDAGCGGGRAVAETLADRHEVVGVDLSRSQLALARERVPGVRLVQGELTRLPLATGVADALCSLHAVIHVPRERHDAVFAEFARVLSPGGELLVTLGTGAWEGRNDDWLGDAAETETEGESAETDGDSAGTEGDSVETDDESAGTDGDSADRDDDEGSAGAPMCWSFHGADRSRTLLREAGFTVEDETVLGDELGGGEWLFLRARLTTTADRTT